MLVSLSSAYIWRNEQDLVDKFDLFKVPSVLL